jgi:hypothetical protein
LIFLVGGLVGAGVTVLLSRRRKKLQAERERELREEMAGEVAGRVAAVLDQVMTRFESLEERLEFSEQLMFERPSERTRDPR